MSKVKLSQKYYFYKLLLIFLLTKFKLTIIHHNQAGTTKEDDYLDQLRNDMKKNYEMKDKVDFVFF